MWDGAFSPHVRKHRDYQHATFLEHELANGGEMAIEDYPVYCDVDPITEDLFDEPVKYWPVDIQTHYGDWYRYLVPAMANGNRPTFEQIRDMVNRYIHNPTEDSRDWWDYLDLEATDYDGLVQLILSEREKMPQAPARIVSVAAGRGLTGGGRL